ncbi:asialoglycoprotein receptor 1-like [Carettochelys insculpta]|uniref:asialoglycoprotein receptor 1-like n=1 Tax=Carettochelys insculpta TaxID=44489 RepID=UPI003EB79450
MDTKWFLVTVGFLLVSQVTLCLGAAEDSRPIAKRSTGGSCPRGWDQLDNSCYFFSWHERKWEDARNHCGARNAHLVVINSQKEQDFLERKAESRRQWIGLRRDGGSWRWVNGSPTSFTYWGGGEPNNLVHFLIYPENCVEMRRDGRWNDEICHTPLRWICEKSA